MSLSNEIKLQQSDQALEQERDTDLVKKYKESKISIIVK